MKPHLSIAEPGDTSLKTDGSARFEEKFVDEWVLSLCRSPPLPVFMMARDLGYLNVAFSPVGRIMKRLVGVAGDRVTIDATGVEVNGIRLVNSSPLRSDAAGRPLVPYSLKNYVLEPTEVLLMSEYNPASFDSRYFGPLQTTTIESVVTPLLTWD